MPIIRPTIVAAAAAAAAAAADDADTLLGDARVSAIGVLVPIEHVVCLHTCIGSATPTTTNACKASIHIHIYKQ